eukprot:scaffold1495_cov186-Alexandrium_tamarense.AAC.30
MKRCRGGHRCDEDQYSMYCNSKAHEIGRIQIISNREIFTAGCKLCTLSYLRHRSAHFGAVGVSTALSDCATATSTAMTA